MKNVMDKGYDPGQPEQRAAGILLHPASLPGEEGIGTFGKWAFRFIDFLKDAGQSYWQILPLGPTGFGDSPYLSFSSRAGNPLLIDLEILKQEGWIKDALPAAPIPHTGKIHYPHLIQWKYPLLRKAWAAFQSRPASPWMDALQSFRDSQNSWLEDYALFMSLKKHFNDLSWSQWPEDVRSRDLRALTKWKTVLRTQMEFEVFLQFLFFTQWSAVLQKAHDAGIRLVGDIPLYISLDSADAWVEPRLFKLDEAFNPVLLSGVPPDYFSADGQLWGSPVYNWPFHIETGFEWWLQRFEAKMALADLFRLDHFRGLESYWAVPATATTARSGSWEKAPGRALLQKVKETFGALPLIAEDLGDITPEVEQLRDDFNLPGMHIMQFGFDGNPDNLHCLHHHRHNAVVYTGTHDNDTLAGWINGLSKQALQYLTTYLGCRGDLSGQLLRATMMSSARLAIVPMQDYLRLDSRARMNTPGTIGGNWQWQMDPADLSQEVAAAIRRICTPYGRLAP
jgi:4-alpha-glucanotransferase